MASTFESTHSIRAGEGDGGLPRVCFVALGPSRRKGGAESWKHGGAEQLVVALANWLAGVGAPVSLIGLEPQYWQGVGLVPSVPVLVPCAADRGLPGLRWLHPRLTGVWAAMTRANADIYVQCGAGFLTGQVALYCRVFERRMLFLVTSDSNVDPRRVVRHFRVPIRDRVAYLYGLRQADRLIVQTRWQKEMLERHFRREPLVMPQGLDLAPLLALRRDESGDGAVLWVGRAVPLKRPELFLDLARRFPDVPFIMLTGPGHDAAHYGRIQRAAAELGNLEFLWSGTVDVAAVFARAVLLVSTSHTEGYPNTYIEAWASGLPVVALECDPDELLCREKLGRHSWTFARLVQDVAELLHDRAERRAVGERARAFAQRTHDIRSVGPRYLEVFRQLAPQYLCPRVCL